MELQLPRKLQEEAVIEGNIYFFEKNSSFGIPGHMHVCIKRADKLLFFSTCSSQIHTAIDLSKRFGWDINTFPVYKADDKTNQFKDSLTYVNCNRCYEISVSDFVDLLDKRQIRLLKGKFSEYDLSLIAQGVKASTQITRAVKKLFE